MLPLGMAMMIGGVAGVAAQLAVRILVQREAGLDGAGYFHAAATLSLTYLGFLISAMSTDYFPRLSALAGDPNKAAELVNDQAEVALLLSGPIILLMLGAAPWVLQLLYAGEFRPAAPLLRWQLLGDVFRVASWPLAYLLLANGRGRRFLFAELTPPVLLIAVTAALLPSLGLVAAGIGVFVSYVAYFGVIHLLTARGEAFRWSAPALRALALLVVSSVLVFLAGEQDSRAGLGVAVAASFLLVIFGLKRLRPAFSELLRRG